MDAPDFSDPDVCSYLEFVGGSAAKFYAAAIEQSAADRWSVVFNYGRIGAPREWARKTDTDYPAQAQQVYASLIGEKLRKGYERRPWPPSLALPSGARPQGEAVAQQAVRGIYRSAASGALPPAHGGSVAGLSLPSGRLLRPMEHERGQTSAPLMWVSDLPDPAVLAHWSLLADAFVETGLWPLIVEPGSVGIDRLDEMLGDEPRTPGADPFQLLRRWWHENTHLEDDDELDEDEAEEFAASISPFGRGFPGFAPRSGGERPAALDITGSDLTGHLGLVATQRPAQVLADIGWLGAVNFDMAPTELSAILDTWEDRFDAYAVGLGFDTLTLAVARPPVDLPSATQVAAEHLAFDSDIIFQGAGSIEAYAPLLVGCHWWFFWWD